MSARGNSQTVPFSSHGSGYSTWLPFLNLLREHAVFVSDAVAEGGQAECRHRIEKAGCQAPEAAVAETRVALAIGHVLEPVRMLGHRRCGRAAQFERGQRVRHRAADQELHRQVVDAARLLAALAALGLDPAGRELLARQLGDGLHQVGWRGRFGRDAHRLQELFVEGRGE